MKLCVATTLIALATGCAMRDPGLVKTQVVTFPDGALVEMNGQRMGRAPAGIILPQDEEGRLTEKAIIRAMPNSGQAALFPQERILEPAGRNERVPNQIMVDMRQGGTNNLKIAAGQATHVESDSKKSIRPSVPHTARSKPTQAVGLDRWNPGIY